MKTSELCRDDTKRRRAVRAQKDVQTNQPDLNGIDYLEVSENDQRILRVSFMDDAPENITVANVRIDGGRRIRKIRVEEVQLCETEDEEHPDCMEVRVDKAGDFSTYTLCLIDLDADGHPTDKPLTGFDVRYTCIDFTFKANCPSDFDCEPEDTCPPKVLDEPEINYLAKDYASFRQLILDRLSLIMPGWQERHIPDIGITLVEILAYVGDYLSYYQDAVATEAYLETARQRISVRRHTRLVDYPMHEGCNARTWLFLEMQGQDKLELNPIDIYFITGQNDALPVSGTILSELNLQGIPSSDYEVFEPLLLDIDTQQSIQLYSAHNKIPFYTWGDQECCLPRGATTATLRDNWLPAPAPTVKVEQQQQQKSSKSSSTSSAKSSKSKRAKQQEPPEDTYTSISPAPQELPRILNLQVGNVLIFEEILGPKTANPSDADPKHRHAVRLTKVEPTIDILYNIPVVEIEWGEEDKLPFPLCLSTIGLAPECVLLEDISIARGNVILVDHGKTIQEDLKEVVPTEKTTAMCEGENDLGETKTVAGLYRPRLQQAPLTFRQLLPIDAPFFQPQIPAPPKLVTLTSATSLLLQDPCLSLPAITLTSTLPADGKTLYSVSQDEKDEEDDEDEKEVETTDNGIISKDIIWTVQSDLLESQGDDYHYVVEMDNDGYAHLRFGDGELGHMPEAGTKFHAKYRVGNGLPGNVGAESITHIVFRQNLLSGAMFQPCNPFAVYGGTDPEPLAEIKLFAPYALRKRLERAITADDYARLAERNPKVQRAAAALRWTGSWYEVLVVIDPLGSEEADDALLDEIAAYLEHYRRIGHDLKVVPAHYVSLDIAMTICVLPHYLRGHVKAALLDVFSSGLRPNGRPGFFYPDNLTFGEGIALSKLVASAQAVTGVQSVTVTRLERLGEGPNDELTNEFLPLGPMEIAQLDNDPSFPEHGKLTFKMVGGR